MVTKCTLIHVKGTVLFFNYYNKNTSWAWSPTTKESETEQNVTLKTAYDQLKINTPFLSVQLEWCAHCWNKCILVLIQTVLTELEGKSTFLQEPAGHYFCIFICILNGSLFT